ncbi:unnamed protein product [Protopolystoma xenopodis]|uniref:Uncharacterized protein n=1 Tax=Protopolystoma xenopodis TaxID=117903 RepID=A0A3S5BGZ6_9PLAT|nr:unnamed protein product [Protopolystoma xenopodis]
MNGQVVRLRKVHPVVMAAENGCFVNCAHLISLITLKGLRHIKRTLSSYFDAKVTDAILIIQQFHEPPEQDGQSRKG